jgi:hypothetical protein
MEEHSLYERDEPNLAGLERELYEEVSETEPWEVVERFNDLERVSGTEDEREAAECISHRLNTHGIPYDRYDPEVYLSRPEDATIKATGAVNLSFETEKTVAFSNSGSIRGEVVYLDANDDEDDDLAGAFDVGLSVDDIDFEVNGKIVVAESIVPIDAIAELADAGAAGFVGIHPHETEPHEGIATPVWGGIPNPQDDEAHPDIVVANVSRSEGNDLLEHLRQHDALELELTAETTTGWFSCPVILSRIGGKADPEQDDFVLLHGHYDSWHVGITDNATGDAALLECARTFDKYRNRLNRNLWLAWWPGHSTGRYAGSTWFVDEFAHDLYERCVAHVNVDSPGVKDATEFVGRSKWMPEAHSLCRDAIDDVCGKSTEWSRPPRAGDYSFNNVGIPGMSPFSCIPQEIRDARGHHSVGGSGGHADAWHLTTDTIEKADADVLVRDIRVFTTIVSRLLNEEVLPLDHRHTLERHAQVVDDYASKVGDHFDFDPVQTEIKQLRGAVDELYDAIESGRLGSEDANEAITNLSRGLTRLDFNTEGVFEQDPAVYRPPYPKLVPALDLPILDGDEYRFQQVHLKRHRNAVVQELKQLRSQLPVSE